MDKAITSKKRGTILKGDWKTKLTSLIDQFRDDNIVRLAELRLPIGYSLKTRKFGKIPEYQLNSLRSRKGKLRVMVLFIEKTRFDSINLGLKMSFKMPITDTYKMLKPDFHYKWDHRNDNVTIKRFLGSTDIDTLEENINKLLTECIMFKNMYEDTEEAEQYNPDDKDPLNSLPF